MKVPSNYFNYKQLCGFRPWQLFELFLNRNRNIYLRKRSTRWSTVHGSLPIRLQWKESGESWWRWKCGLEQLGWVLVPFVGRRNTVGEKQTVRAIVWLTHGTKTGRQLSWHVIRTHGMSCKLRGEWKLETYCVVTEHMLHIFIYMDVWVLLWSFSKQVSP